MSELLDVLTEQESRAVRDAVAEAVLGGPSGLREDLAHDPDAYLRLVAASRTAAEETSRLLVDSVCGARAAGHSWDALGRLLGVSRQAAQQRFGGPALPEPLAGGRTRKVLTPLTAFTEMAVLEQAGRQGWHVVAYGPLYHVVEASDRQWEHRRFTWAPGQERRRQAEGWMRVPGPAFPWAYYGRPLDAPAEQQ